MSFINPQPCQTSVNFEGICCPELCLIDGTPILIVFSDGVESGWVNLLTGIFTPGPPPAGSGSCPVNVLYDYMEDSPHVSGDFGAFVLAVRNDAGTPLAADGDYSPLQVNEAGELRVTTVTSAPTGRDDTDNQAAVATGLSTNVIRNYVWDGANWDRWDRSITDGGGSITVDGTVAVTQSTSPWVTSLDATTLAALESITVQNPGGASAVNIQDGGNSITVDGTVTADTNFDFPEDSVHVSGDIGAFVLAVRNDAGTPLAGATGDYIPFTTDANGDLFVTTGRNGSIANGAETAVAAVAVSILAANTARKKYIVQNTGTANIRVGVTGVTATTGFRLVPGGSMVIEMPNCPTNAIFAIREGATSSIAFAQEIV